MKTDFVLITPVVAAEMLKQNNFNRVLRPSRVAKYSKIMSEGNWEEETGEAILVAETGRILSGQHRLHAVIDSGKSLKFLITSGLKESVFTVLDSGAKRTSADVFGIAKIAHATILPPIINLYDLLLTDKIDSKESLSSEKLLGKYQSNVLFWSEVAVKTHSWHKEFGKVLSPSIIGAMYALFYRRNAADADEFMKQLCSGMFIENETLGLLRKKLAADRISHKKMSLRFKCALIIKVWNAIRNGQDLKIIKFTPEKEKFPRAL